MVIFWRTRNLCSVSQEQVKNAGGGDGINSRNNEDPWLPSAFTVLHSEKWTKMQFATNSFEFRKSFLFSQLYNFEQWKRQENLTPPEKCSIYTTEQHMLLNHLSKWTWIKVSVWGAGVCFWNQPYPCAKLFILQSGLQGSIQNWGGTALRV